MKLYRVSYTPAADGAKEIFKWAGTQAGVVQVKKDFMELGAKRKQISTEEIDVPTKKDELIEWLNSRSV